jgi:hypothetical protein
MAAKNSASACRCHQPPFHFEDYETSVLGDDSTWAEVSIDRCRNCGTYWLNYLIEEEHFSRSGRWWRVVVPEAEKDHLQAKNAREFIEQQASGFYGGSYFSSTGIAFHDPIRIR